MMLFGKIAASLLCALAAALALMRAGRAERERENRCKYLLLIALLTVGCSCVNWLAVDALPLSGLSQADTVTITALNEKNSASHETTLYLTGVFVNGHSQSIHVTGEDSWLNENWYKWYDSANKNYVSGQASRSFTVALPAGSHRYLEFLGNSAKGIVQVECCGEVQTVDCYAPKDTRIRVALPDTPVSVQRTEKAVRLAIATALLAVELALAVWLLLRESAVPHAPKERERWLDVLKLLASYLIVMIHSVGTVYNRGPAGDSNWLAYFLLNIFPRCAVPVFLLTTGIFVLGRPMDTKKWLKKLVHFLVLLVFWNAFYIVLDMLLHHRDTYSLAALLRSFASIPVKRGPSTPLWYSYQLVWIYALAPFFFKLHAALDRAWQRRLIVISLLLPSLLACYGQVFDLGGTVYSHSFVQIFYIGFMGFLFLGRYIYDYMPADSRLQKSAGLLIVLGLGLTALLCRLYLSKHGDVTHQYFSELSIGPLCYGTGVFILFYRGKAWFQAMPEKLGRAVSWLAERAIGIYFLHQTFIWCFGANITLFGVTVSRTGAWWSAVCYTLIVWALTVVSVVICSYLPGLRKLVT